MIKSERNVELYRFVTEAKRAADAGLMLCSSGNLSWRIGDDLALVSGTGSWLPTLAVTNVSGCQISKGERLEGPKPSKASSFHLGVVRTSTEVKVVLHFQLK